MNGAAPGVILVVDDDPDDAVLFCMACRKVKVPYAVQVAGSGKEALDLLLEKRIAPLLTVLDIKMPGIDGLEVLRRLRADKICRAAVVVVLTGSDLTSDRNAAAGLGCNLFLTKPTSFTGYLEIAQRIKSLLAVTTAAPVGEPAPCENGFIAREDAGNSRPLSFRAFHF